MTYWFVPSTHTLIEAGAAPDPDAVEMTAAQWDEMQANAAKKRPVATSLRGNAATHTTNGRAHTVSIYVIAPVGGNVSGRPLLNGVPICATPGGAPIVLDQPGTVTIVTKAGNNDLMIVEEFDA